MTKITYSDKDGRYRLSVEGHAVRVNADDHSVICACVSAVVAGLLDAMPEYLAAEAVEDGDGGLTIEADGNYIRIEPGFAEFDITPDPEDADFYRGAFEHAARCFEWIEREWPRYVDMEY